MYITSKNRILIGILFITASTAAPATAAPTYPSMRTDSAQAHAPSSSWIEDPRDLKLAKSAESTIEKGGN
ncbi:MAG: hypothetical protein ACI915_005589 [Gammaproteobacteria bacterium]|jgi:hypothetical protein